MKPKPPLKYSGGKTYLADWIISHFPSHSNYVEPYFGGGAVLLAKNPEGVSEVVNDLSWELTTFWNVLKEYSWFKEFVCRCEATPFSEAEWKRSCAVLTDNWCDYSQPEKAHAFFVRCRQSLAGRMESFTAISTSRRRRGMNEQVSGWLTTLEGLPEVHNRLKRVLILNREATDVIRQFDKPDTVIYCDPPYVHSTRASKALYEHEMDDEQHIDLLDCVLAVKSASVVLSGYRSALYDTKLKDWRRVDKEIANHSSGATEKRRMVESLWMNY
jgi:DNA adenine methylase